MKKDCMVREVGQSRRLAILEALQQAPEGLDVKSLAGLLKMSYMGIKTQCLKLQEQGYLTTWRQPQERGRPQLYYRLTPKASEFFSDQNHHLLLSILLQAKKLFGEKAPQKLLLMHFRTATLLYQKKIFVEDPQQRAQALAKIRHYEGYLSQFEKNSPWRILEHQHPFGVVLQHYPEAIALENQMLSIVIGVPIKRQIEIEGGGFFSKITSQHS